MSTSRMLCAVAPQISGMPMGVRGS